MLKPVIYKVPSPKLPAAFDGFRILHLSDLHSASFGKKNYRLLKAAESARPDIVVMTGDMVNGGEEHFSVFLHLAAALAGQWEVYYIMGNHEQTLKPRRQQDLLRALGNAGVHVLGNESVDLKRGDDRIRLYGMYSHMRYYRDLKHCFDRHAHFTATDLRELVGPADPDLYNILLAHNPLYFPSYAKWGADLTLSGHIHGGIIRLPVFGGLLSPEFKFFPRYDGGFFTWSGRCLEVSRGLGNNFLWRINNPPELPLLILRREDAVPNGSNQTVNGGTHEE